MPSYTLPQIKCKIYILVSDFKPTKDVDIVVLTNVFFVQI